MDTALLDVQNINVVSLRYAWPEVTLACGVLTLFLIDLLMRRHERRVEVLTASTFGFLAVAGLALWKLGGAAAPADGLLFNGMLFHDGLSVFFRWIFLGATALAVWLAAPSTEVAAERKGEYFALLLAMCLGLHLMAGASDFLMVFLGVELVSLVSYLLAGYRRGDRRAAEAALKYVIYGGVASGVMLFGISYLYGLLGTTQLSALPQALQGLAGNLAGMEAQAKAGTQLALLVAVLFVLAGVGYKVASVPWHMWCPDVYEGAPTPFTAFLSVGPKAAGFAVAMRIFFGGMAQVDSPALEQVGSVVGQVPWPAILGAIAAVTMTLGNFAAIHQNNLKRLLAYSSIAHAGYIMMGLASSSNAGNLSVLVYLVFYVLMNVGAFVVVGAVARSSGSESIFDYRGLAKRAPFAAAALAVFLFSLTGLPPLAGFIGKFYLFYAVVVRASASAGTAAMGWWVLAIVGALNSAVSLYYYARVVKAMYLEKSTETRPMEIPLAYSGLMAGLMLAVMVFGVWWSPIAEAAQAAISSMVG